MNFLSVINVEFRKIRRSKILLILMLGVVILWIPSIVNANINFGMEDVGISPENNFFIQGFMGMCWFIFPASMVVSTVMLIWNERGNRGLIKMLSLPVSPIKLCLAKFVILLILAAIQIFMSVGIYYVSAAIASHIQGFNFVLPPAFVLKEAAILLFASVPMLAVFWAIAVCVGTAVFSVGIGLASIVPSVLVINTKAWFAYPMAYPFYFITSEYGKLASNLEPQSIEPFPFIPVSLVLTFSALALSCVFFGKKERK